MRYYGMAGCCMSVDGKNRLIEDWFRFAGEDAQKAIDAASEVEQFVLIKRG